VVIGEAETNGKRFQKPKYQAQISNQKSEISNSNDPFRPPTAHILVRRIVPLRQNIGT
jgi:hypothetical protein